MRAVNKNLENVGHESRRFLVDKRQDHLHSHRGDEEVVFAAYLRSQGLKLTKARKDLLAKVFEMHDHFTADQLLERLRRDRVRTSKATVYRTLSVLLQCGLLAGHDFGEGALYYEHIHGHEHHDHLFCLHCKAITEFVDPQLEERQERVVQELGFHMVSHSLKLYGVCVTCAADPEVLKIYRDTPGAVGHRS